MKNLEFEKINCLQISHCRRYQLDRRVTSLGFVKRLFHRGERRFHRRNKDYKTFMYLDRHEPHLLLISILVLLFSFTDAFLTLKILETGGVELNYFADKLIGLGLYGFIFTKYLITAFGMIILVIHKNYPFYFGLQVRHLIYGIVFIYTFLLFYEVIIILLH
ncbi:MAG: DUF5658 family protein [Thiohalomonadales bacterium]